MSVRAVQWNVALVTGLVWTADSLAAQPVTVRYDHGNGPRPQSRVSYQLAGDEITKIRAAGEPMEFAVKKGQTACVRIVDGNPLLYAYSVDTGTVAPPASEEGKLVALFGTIINALSGTTAAKVASKFRVAGGPSATNYGSQVSSLYTRLQAIETAIESSDAGSFDLLEGAFKIQYESAASLNQAADESWERMDAVEKDSAEFTRFSQKLTWEAIQTWKTKLDVAVSKRDQPICYPVTAPKMRFTLAIKPTLKREGKTPARITNPQVTFTVESRSADRVYFSPGLVLSTFVQDNASFAIVNGVVDSTSNHDPAVGAALFAHYRIGSSPFFATFGASDNNATAPDGFLGLTFRDEFMGSAVSLGAGMVLRKTPVRLSQGQDGAALPADAGDLKDLIVRQYRPGLGIAFSITGLSLEKKSAKTP